MVDFIVIAILLLIVGMAIAYIVKSKKRGVKCIGCPSSGTCCSKNHENTKCNCENHADTK